MTTPFVGSGKPYQAMWFFTAEWAHPAWSRYCMVLYDLTTKIEDGSDPVIHREGMNYEMQLTALAPDRRQPVDGHYDGIEEIRLALEKDSTPMTRLTPQNYVYQFPAVDDRAAHDRLQAIYEQIMKRELSPDTDHYPTWDTMFEDGVSLIQRGGGLTMDMLEAIMFGVKR